ncbi:serine hydrolase [Streptomyces sp. NBC_00370]|uniref:serine hydrolase n=1 Tax=Streptomyces sp. NBC_00370 TaxID=2975728 RepID=UPI002E2552FA
MPRSTLYTSAAVALFVVVWAAVDGGQSPASGAVPPTPRPSAPLTPLAFPVTPGPTGPLPRVLPPGIPAPSPKPGPAPKPAPKRTPVAKPAKDPQKVLADLMEPIDAGTSASVSVAVIDMSDGRTARYGVRAGRTYDTASIVKVDVLAALLLRAQDHKRRLTAQEKTYASAMIRVSDNDSTDALWQIIGGAAGLEAANRRLGLTETEPGAAGLWGLTRTTAKDQLTLLSAVFGDHPALDKASKAYLRGLMGEISPGQDWGVSAAGHTDGLKNGWLPRSATGLWDINSIGRVTVDGHPCLLAVLSKGHTSQQAGIEVVEKAARAAVTALGLKSGD